MVGYVFGCLDADAVPGPILVQLLTGLGLSASAARTMLHRMVARGQLTSGHTGRVAVYELSGTYREHFVRLRDGDREPTWSGQFEAVLYDIPETLRSTRDELREKAFAAGFGAARAGLLIGLNDPTRWAGPWLDDPRLDVDRVQLSCDLATATRLAARAWRLTQVDEATVHHLAYLDPMLARVSAGAMSHQDAFVALFDVWGRFAGIQLLVPPLPAAILPQGWGGELLRRRHDEANYALGPLAWRHTQTVIAESSCRALLRLRPDAWPAQLEDEPAQGQS